MFSRCPSAFYQEIDNTQYIHKKCDDIQDIATVSLVRYMFCGQPKYRSAGVTIQDAVGLIYCDFYKDLGLT